MNWWTERTIDLGRGEFVSPLWHCFGVKDEIVDRDTAIAMLAASGTSALPINTHRLTNYLDPSHLLIGHGSVTFTWMRNHAIYHSLVPMLNVNLQTTHQRAVQKAVDARYASGIDLLKLEVLTDDLKESRDASVVSATAFLVDQGFRVMPLISANPPAAVELEALGVPLIRVMGSPIGSGRGIEDREAIAALTTSVGVPVILDGGIGSSEHCLEAMRLGCAGFLVNSMLFAGGSDPVESLRRLTADLAAAPAPLLL